MSNDPPPVPAQSSTDLLVDVFATEQPAAPVETAPPTYSGGGGGGNLLEGTIFFVNSQTQ